MSLCNWSVNQVYWAYFVDFSHKQPPALSDDFVLHQGWPPTGELTVSYENTNRQFLCYIVLLFQNESKGKAFLMQVKLSVTYIHKIEPVSGVHSHNFMNGWTQRLVLTWRQKETVRWKWPVTKLKTQITL